MYDLSSVNDADSLWWDDYNNGEDGLYSLDESIGALLTAMDHERQRGDSAFCALCHGDPNTRNEPISATWPSGCKPNHRITEDCSTVFARMVSIQHGMIRSINPERTYKRLEKLRKDVDRLRDKWAAEGEVSSEGDSEDEAVSEVSQIVQDDSAAVASSVNEPARASEIDSDGHVSELVRIP